MSTNGFKVPRDGFHPTQLKIETAHIEADLAHKKMRKEFNENILGKLFSSHFFVFLVTAAVVASGLMFMQKTAELEKIIDYWKVILPLVTTYIGYAIGRGKDGE
jgi:hypothetical protein